MIGDRAQAMISLLVDGQRNKDVAAQFSVSTARVSKLRKRAIRDGLVKPITHRLSVPRILPALDSETSVALRLEANRRRITVDELMRDILDTVARDGLFAAVLD